VKECDKGRGRGAGSYRGGVRVLLGLLQWEGGRREDGGRSGYREESQDGVRCACPLLHYTTLHEGVV